MKKKQIKLAIATPTTGFVRIEYVESLLNLFRLKGLQSLGVVDTRLFYFCSSVIPKNRHEIIEQAQQWGATHVLFIDDDMRFPPYTAEGLLARMVADPSKQIIGANCIKRQYPIEFMARDFNKKQVVSIGKEGVEEVYYTGNAFVLVNIEVFKKVPKPWFHFDWEEEYQDHGTEDVFFMKKAREYGIGTYIDHEVSQLIDHIGIWTFMPQHLKV